MSHTAFKLSCVALPNKSTKKNSLLDVLAFVKIHAPESNKLELLPLNQTSIEHVVLTIVITIQQFSLVNDNQLFVAQK